MSPIGHREQLSTRRLRERLVEIDPVVAANRGAIRVVRAPGRVNLIGEHTDYNLGFVLPAAIDLEIRLAFVPTDDRRVEITTEATGERQAFALDAIGPRHGTWIDYIAGTAWSLEQAGVATRGLRGLLSSSLPQGAGLGSSAALELAAAWALAPEAQLSGLALAQVCQRAENDYVGVSCGLMDQFASGCGVDGAAVALDCRSLESTTVPLPLATHTLVVCDTGSSRRLTTSDYNARRAQCERAVATLSATDPGIHSLRDVTVAMLPAIEERVDTETFRRCRHVVTENQRVEETITALARGDLASVGRSWAASHASLRDDYEVVSSELEALVDTAARVPGVAASRMTGAGFGGCTINLVDRNAVDRLRARVLAEYPSLTGLQPRVWAVEPVGGAGPVANQDDGSGGGQG